MNIDTSTSRNLQALYLDYFNNYLTVDLFAEHKELDVEAARLLVDAGRIQHESIVSFYKSMGV